MNATYTAEGLIEGFGGLDDGAPAAAGGTAKRFEWDLGDDALGELVDLIKNNFGVDRTKWLAVAHGIAGAGGGFEIFDMFSERYEGVVDAAETLRVWETLPESQSGGGVLRAMAEADDPEGFAAWKQKWEAPAVFSDEAIGADEVAAAVGLDRSYSTGDFVAFLPTQRYVYLPTGDLWVKEAINSIIAPVVVGVKANGEPRTMKPAAWLDREAGVSQMSWLPGKPRVVTGMTVSPDGLRPQRAAAIYNIYRAPEVEAGDAGKAKPWLDHVRGLYPADAEHLFDFFAHAVQKPWEKVNHGALLGGAPGIGKDTMLHPVLRAVGFSNTCSISPSRIKETFNPWVRSVVLVIDELRDLGDVNQWAFYEQTKTLLAAPPMTTMINEKFKPAYPVPNVVHVVMTTNSKTDGLYLPEDDRRHYVAWSVVAGTGDKNCQPPKYFVGLWDWMDKQGGTGHVAAWLRARDLKGFDPKAPPPQTKAFRDIVGANRPVEESPIADALDLMGRPGAFTLDWLKAASTGELAGWLSEPKNRRIVPKRLEREGYEVFHNPDVDDGRWRIGPDKVIVYTDRKLTYREKETRIKGLYAAQSAAMDAIFKAGQP